jgi:hypothetical protein
MDLIPSCLPQTVSLSYPLGLEGKLTATVPGERFVQAVAPILVEVRL